jgi:hypothetical protein
MKLFITTLLLCVTLLSCCVFPVSTEIICTRNDCQNYVTNNKANILFVNEWETNFAHDGRKYDVNISCQITNTTGDTMLFDRNFFSLHSTKTTFINSDYFYMQGKKIVVMPNVFKIPPGTMSYNLRFTSKKGMSEREYRKRILTDTVSLLYCNQQQTDTIFKMTVDDRYR